MRKIFLAFAALMTGTIAFAQPYSPGQYIELEGVPGIVISVDSDGEHGLAVSMPGLIDSRYQKLWVGNVSKKEVEAAFAAHPNWIYTAKDWIFNTQKTKVAQKLWDEVAAELWDRLGSDGEKNTEAIKEYCSEKGYSLKEYFPWVEWSTGLGEGWYSPGNDELAAFAEFYAGGIGRDFKMGKTKWLLRAKELSNDHYQVRYALQVYAVEGFLSTSLCEDKKGVIWPQHLAVMSSQAGPSWFIWNDGMWGSMLATRQIAAFKKF